MRELYDFIINVDKYIIKVKREEKAKKIQFMKTKFKLFEKIDYKEISVGDFVKIKLKNFSMKERRQKKIDFLYNNYFKVYDIDEHFCSIIIDNIPDDLKKSFSDYEEKDDKYYFSFNPKFIISYGKTIYELERRLKQHNFNI